MFLQAVAISPDGNLEHKNLLVAYKTVTNSLKGAILRIACADFYQVFINGTFVAFGPARTAKGYARMDILPLDNFDGNHNEVIIYVADYGCRTLSTAFQPSFLIAEIVRNGEAIAYTGKHFTAFTCPQKIQKTERYSYQRHYGEVWDLRLLGAERELAVKRVDCPTLLERRATYPHYEDVSAKRCTAFGGLAYDETLPFTSKRYSAIPSAFWGTFTDEEIEYHPYTWIQRHRQNAKEGAHSLPLTLSDMQYAVLDFGRIETGFFQLFADCEEDADVIVAFSEYCPENAFAFTNNDAHNAIEYLLPKGCRCTQLSYEPYVARHAIVAVKRGKIALKNLSIKTFEREISSIRIPDFGNETLNRIYFAAMRTLAHNAVDIPTDCPSRERAGWLCDSFFIARTEYALYGNTAVEDAHLENYVLFCNDGSLPDGMVPMCYPSIVEENGNFIPQWSLWLILQIEEYVNLRGHKGEKERFRPLVDGILSFFKRHENEDGLLEKLPSWNFVEWSKANEWTQDVNYPTNFLYAEALERAYRLFGDERLLARSNEVRETAIGQSFDGTLFCDHAIRKDGALVLQKNRSETAQYYALLFGKIDLSDKRYTALSDLVYGGFSPLDRNAPEDVVEVNAFLGIYLRLEYLVRTGRKQLAVAEIKRFFGGMEESTGTLWENRTVTGSLDHGFASYVAVMLLRLFSEK